MSDFNEKIAVITGAASGIGLQITRQIIARGGIVVGSDINENALKKVSKELGDSFHGVTCDAGSVSDIEDLFKEVDSQYGRLDLLVNNAGIGGEQTPESVSEEEYDKLMNIMLKGPVFHLKFAASLLRRSEDGNVINISSASSRMSMPAYCPYALAKAAIEKLTEDSVIQVPGIRHNCIMPGFIDTPILKTGYGEEGAEQMKVVVKEVTPVQRVGRSEDIANMTLFLASDQATFINGACILIDGGVSRLNKFN